MSDKRQLIYEAAGEAVMELRLKLARMDSRGEFPDGRTVDEMLFKAQCNAGKYALAAVDADARKVKSVAHLLREPSR